MNKSTLVYIRWKDAVNSNSIHSLDSIGDLAELHEVGFLHKESAETITIGTESEEGATEVRFWITLPKANIIEIRRTSLAKAFPMKRERVVKVARNGRLDINFSKPPDKEEQIEE